MSETNLYYDPETWTENDEQLPSFTIELFEGGDGDYHTQNDPAAPLQRDTYVERKGATDIRCECKDVIHGLFSPKGEAFATLIILDFRFDSRKRARRITSADIKLTFAGMKDGENGPEVFAISPYETLNIVPTAYVEATTKSGNVTLGGGSGVTASGTVGWEKAVTKDREDKTVVIGSIDLVGRNYGKKNCASFTLLENSTMKTGVPVYMRAAILLRRKDEKPFKCLVKINADVDFKTSIQERVFGRKARDDPVLFDPELPPTNNLQEYEIENLGAFNLQAASDLTFATVLKNVIKEKTLD